MEIEEEKKMILKDINEDIEYIFTIKNEGDYLHFIATENDEHCPFLFENNFNLEDFIEHHKAFKACDNIEEVEQHFYKLYEKGKLDIAELGGQDEKQIQAKIGDISEETDAQEFDLIKKTKYTEKDVMDFYQIYKKDKKLKETIKKVVKKGLEGEHPVKKQILALLRENENKE